METVTILWSLAAGASLTLAAMCAAAWSVERRNLPTLMLSLLGVAAAISAYLELRMMHSATPREFGSLLRYYHGAIFLAMLAQTFFVHYYLETSRRWLMWTFIFARAVVLVVNFSVYPNINFLSIESLGHVSLFGDRVAAIDAAITRPGWQQFATATLILFVAYMVDAAARRWRRGDSNSKRQVLVVAMGLVIPMICELGYGQLQVFGIVHGTFSFLPWFLAGLLIMANELVRNVIVTRRTLRELAELQSQLARVERISILGQLATSLAHELAQPLSANVLNATASLKNLDVTKTDAGEQRTILRDILHDSERAAAVLNRIRTFLRRGAIEMQPIRVEDVVKDTVSLAGDVASKHVVLTVRIPPDLPAALGDRVHLSQVLLNLLTNSIDALQSRPSNARHVLIEAHVENRKGQIEVAVRDNGAGIAEDIADKIFDPFFTTKPQGTGVGLALSRAIIEAQGGHLWLDRSVQGEGAIFRFSLQRAKLQAAAVPEPVTV